MCETCRGNAYLASAPTTTELASNRERHSFLLRCGVCGELFEDVPEARRGPRPVTEQEARELFPGAL